VQRLQDFESVEIGAELDLSATAIFNSLKGQEKSWLGHLVAAHFPANHGIFPTQSYKAVLVLVTSTQEASF
jgi:hypothetical protein